MAFPSNLTNAVDGITDVVADHLNNLEAKVGIDGSLVTTSLDYLLKNPASVDPGHMHTRLSISGLLQSDIPGLTDALAAKQPNGNYLTALTGDVAASGPGSAGAAIQAGAVTFSKMANLAAGSIIGNNTALPAAPLALTAAQVKTLLAIAPSDVGLSNVTNDVQIKLQSSTPGTAQTGNLNISGVGAFGILNVGGINFIYYPDTNQFRGSLILSDGGGVLAHTVDQEGWLNTFVGAHTGLLNTTGYENTFVGGYAGWHNTTGAGNVGIGSGALQANTTGNFNVVVGADCGLINTTGSQNCFFGNGTGGHNLIGNNNSFFGYHAGFNSIGDKNCFFGNNAGAACTGSYNVCIGESAGGIFTNQNNNVCIGYYAGNYETGSGFFYLDAFNRGGLTPARTGALMWGAFNATANSQNLTINASTWIYNKASGGTLTLGGGDNGTGANHYVQLRLGFNGAPDYPHFMISRHNGGAATSNAIDFYTSDGTQAGTFPTNAVLGLTITNGAVGIGTTTPNVAAKLHLSSTTKGFLPPVMTTTQKNAISTPPAGLVVYDSTLNKLCVYAGAAWQTITSS